MTLNDEPPRNLSSVWRPPKDSTDITSNDDPRPNVSSAWHPTKDSPDTTLSDDPLPNVSSVWHPPKNDRDDDEILDHPPRRLRTFYKVTGLRPKQPIRRVAKSAKKEAREKRTESNALLQTIHEFTSIKVIKKVREFLQCKIANVNTTDSIGQSPLMYAVRYQKGDKSLQLIQMLIAHGAYFNAKDGKGRTALHLAIKHGNYSAAIHMIAHYPTLDLNAMCNKGETPLKMCVRFGDATMDILLALLATKRVNVNAICYQSESKRQTALHLAAVKGSRPIVELLVNNGASLNSQDGDSHTPLMLAAVNFHTSVVRLLLDAGADQSITDSEGKTAAQLTALKFYGSGLETVNSFIAPAATKQTPKNSPEQLPRKESVSTQTDREPIPAPPIKVEVTVEPIVEEPEEVEMAEVLKTEEQPDIEIIEVPNDEPVNEPQSVVPWAPSMPKIRRRSQFKQRKFFGTQRLQRPNVMAYRRVVQSTQGSKRQTFYFGVNGQQNVNVSNFYQPRRQF